MPSPSPEARSIELMEISFSKTYILAISTINHFTQRQHFIRFLLSRAMQSRGLQQYRTVERITINKIWIKWFTFLSVYMCSFYLVIIAFYSALMTKQKDKFVLSVCKSMLTWLWNLSFVIENTLFPVVLFFGTNSNNFVCFLRNRTEWI